MAQGEIFKGLPKWAQGVIAVAVVGGAGYLVYQFYKKIQSQKEKKESKEVVNDANSEIKNLEKQGQKLSFPLANYSSAANTIAKLLNGCETFETEVQAIYEVMKVVKNKLDWYQLVKSFGNRDIEDCGWGKTNYDLPTLLKDQLDSAGLYSFSNKDFKKKGFAVNSIYILEEYLKTKGITI